jgi:hypothetical protein
MIPKKPAPDLIRGGNRFSDKIMLTLELCCLLVASYSTVSLSGRRGSATIPFLSFPDAPKAPVRSPDAT